ncbi:four helix bundle protein [Candidatus Kaiserbacteria bacterium]|nr:four helix bundle protein [Candidatus Kaiserbacteria bacterium]
MNDFDTPIFKKTYDLYKTFYGYRADISRQDRYTIWQKCESLILEILEAVLLAGHIGKAEKLPVLENASSRLNLLRVFIRLMSDVKAIDNKKYVILQSDIDEIGRMLGGWIRSSRDR